MTAPLRARQAHLGVATSLEQLAAAGTRFITLFEHGSLQVEIYVPRGAHGELIDPQMPHTRDELYVVARGTGVFFNGTTRRPVQAGALLFVAAGVPHRFEDFSEDLAVWVMFYGPEGGEARAET
jgi:mannose-6-phosphate isomerase-like protein (cupin superfamily)